ncbi:MAG: transcription antitermination protein NusB [Sodaliphilus pleomorphus]|jgi:N utilization substance protein B|nr:transcription antitermination protein NusB [Sodaliphilus pleomorphus]MDY6252614.1 transcription antitermination protein NusB [Bacteroidales bacterium]MDD6475575.1 transcription antitermination protein NusB [Sodaliphilus pleomorphus]MDD6687491.1 transcription antitermination protein NusB [Sodaliphilus pleomorphus]MDD7066577.1 transcription antitermination protein NusB [Sodaliphilus pleomorphus]MDY2832706.1 transcription antitermination protein NusB [Sodaliphilus pleomorphus]
MLYSYQLTKTDKTITKAKKELQASLDKSYELYNSLLQLMIDLTDLQDRELDDAKHKFLPSNEDLNPNMRFVENQLVEWLRNSKKLQDFVNDNNITWRDDELFLRLLLFKVTGSEEYKTYMAMEKTDFASDCEVWLQIMKKVILPDDDLLEHIENMSVYWSVDDLDIMGQFVLKTIRRIEAGDKEPISPKYKDDEDSEFGEKLFSLAVQERAENDELINKYVRSERWDSGRIALMDRIIMCTALTEIKNFPSIPVNVTMNEYIELAKNFSTPHSGQFVNGILNAVVKSLREQGKIVKQ